MSLSIRLMPEAVKTIDFSAIGAAYMGIGTEFENAARILHVQNLTDALLMFSFDGIEDHFPLARSGYILLDIASNKTISQGFYLAEGQRIYVREMDAPTEGGVYITSFYGARV